MGQRTIDTILKLSGEGEYRDALKRCGSEMKIQKSELARLTSEYRTNANSMEAISAKGNVLAQMYATQAAKVEVLKSAVKQSVAARTQEQQTLDSLTKEYDAAKSTMDAYGKELGEGSKEYQEAKAKVDALRDSIIDHKAKLDAATKSTTDYTVKLNRAEVELDDLTDQQEENNRLMEEAKASADGCAKSIDRYGDSVIEAADSTERSTSAVEALSGAMVASGIQQEVEDLAAAMMDCANASAAYETAVRKVSTIADENVMSQRDLSQGIMELSSDLHQNAEDVAEASYEALSAGVKTSEALGFVRESSKLAVAGFTDNATAVDVLTTVLNAYDMEASQAEVIASKLVKTQDLGKLTVDDMGKVLGRVIPSAAAYNVGIDNITASYAMMTSKGINAENTTTYLSTMMDELADSGSKVAGVLQDQTGKSFADLMAEGLSLGDVLDIIGESVNNDNTQFGNLWSSATAGKAAIALFSAGAEKFNDTLDQMANASGTVAKNYEKMASSSEFAQQKMEVSANNLKIVVGDQLNPVLNDLRNSGADVLDTAADVVENCPVLVAGVVGVASAVGVLAGALSIVTAIKAVQSAMAALNITMLANPAVLIATAVVGLGAAMATLAAQSNAAEEELLSLTQASRELSGAVEANQQSYDDAIVSTQAAADTALTYIDRLEELEAQGLSTEAAQLEYQMTLDQINALLPGINATLDAQSNTVRGGTEALREQAAAWQETAIQQAAYARYQSDMAAYSDALYECNKNRALLSMEEKNAEGIQKQLEASASRVAEVEKEIAATAADSTMTTEEQNAALQALDDELMALSVTEFDLGEALEASEEKQAVLNTAIEDGDKALTDMLPAVDAATDAYKRMAGGLPEAGTTVETTTGKVASSVNAMATSASDDMQKMYEESLGSIDRQCGLFDKLTVKSEYSLDQMKENLRSQTGAFNRYSDNIALAMNRGVDIGLVKKLSDGSKESMALLDTLVKGSDKDIQEFNAIFGARNKAAENMAAEMAQVKSAANIGDYLLSQATANGKNNVDGLINGINERKPAYERTMIDLAKAGVEAYKAFNKIYSPSRRYRELAEMDVAGLIVQYKVSKPKLAKAAAELADTGYVASIKSRRAAIPDYSSITRTPAGSRSADVMPMLGRILRAVEKGSVIVLSDGTVVGVVDHAMGQRSSLAERGAL